MPPRRGRALFPLTDARVENWQADHGIGDFDTAELDLRLEAALHAIYSDETLGTRLAWKGGTAINKLFLANAGQYRLSTDLDFNAVGLKHDVTMGEPRRLLRERIAGLLGSLDPNSQATVEHPSYYKDEIRWGYRPLSTPEKVAFIKIEISTVERFAILGYVEIFRSFTDHAAEVTVMTLSPEELLATKIRAFYERRKGRDVYDVHRVLDHHELDRPLLRKMILYYFYRSGHEFSPQAFFANIDQKMADPAYRVDLGLYLRAGDPFAWDETVPVLRRRLAFLEDLNEREADFLMLARYLIGKNQTPARWRVPIEAEYPLRWLFEGCGIHGNASAMTLEDIRRYGFDRPADAGV